MKKEQFQNIHTGEIKTLEKIEIVKNNPENITVWVMTDGTRYDAKSMKHWIKI